MSNLQNGIELNEDLEYIKEYIETRSEQAAYNIVQKYRKFVYLTVLQKVTNSEDAKDITQEIFIKVLNSLHKFNGKSSFKTWLYRVAVNEAINFLRKKKIKHFLSLSSGNNEESEFDMPDSSPNPEKNYENMQLMKRLMDALKKLPPKQREVFMYRYFEEMSYEEISEITNVSVGALKASYFHSIRKLSELLKDLMR